MIVRIDRNSRVPLYEQIAGQLRMRILTEAFIPGHRLPSTRELAESLAVNRKTVVQAYRILRSEGLVAGNGRAGTIVQPVEREQPPRDGSRPVLWSRMMTEFAKPLFMSSDRFYRQLNRRAGAKDGVRSALRSTTGDRDPRLLNDAWNEVIEQWETDGLESYSVRGYPPLCALVARRALHHGIDVHPGRVMITDSIAQSTFLVAMALLHRGDGIALEVPCLPASIHIYDLLGVRIYGVPMDEEGIDLDVLEGLLARSEIKLIHVGPIHRIPTGTSMSSRRGKDLVALAKRYRVPILEAPEYLTEDYEGTPKTALCSVDRTYQTICTSTLESELPMHLRVAWVIAPERMVEAIVPIRQGIHPSTHPLISLLAHRVLTHPDFSLESIRLRAKELRDFTVELLEEHCGDSVTFDVPTGGRYIWTRVRDHVDLAAKLDVLVPHWGVCLPGYFFYPAMNGGERNLCFRFTGTNRDVLSEGIATIGRILRSSA